MTLGKHYEKFWLGLAIPNSKLKLFRFAFFFVFAMDAWLQIGNAPRYGYGDFNVAHFGVLDSILPVPSRFFMSVLYGSQVLLGLRIALGGASRASYVALAALFSYSYFISQLNSYQHHYLLALALCLLAAFPWPDIAPIRAKDDSDKPANSTKSDERFWPVRMLLVALSIMYLFAVIAKLDSEWLDGTTLFRQIQEDWMRDILDSMGWSAAAKLTLLVELMLVFLIQIRRTWLVAIVIGVGMHLTFEFSGLRIGLFSYFMVTLYVLLLPDAWVLKGARALAPVLKPLRDLHRQFESRGPLPGMVVFGVATALGAVLTQSIFIDSVNALTWCMVLFALADLALTRRPAGSGTKALFAVLGLLFFVHNTNGLRTYFHFWGHNDRRAVDYASAVIHYENVVAIDPSYLSGHQRLADSYRLAGREEDALRQYLAGLEVDPKHFKLNRGAARMHHVLGHGSEAMEAAQRALKIRPKDAASLQIRQHWQRQLGTDAAN